MDIKDMTLIDRIEFTMKEGVLAIGEELEADEAWEPALFMASEEEDVVSIMPLAPLFVNAASKEIAGEIVIPMAIKKYKAKAFGLVLTSWIVEIDAKGVEEGELPIDAMVPPSQHPQRQEVLVLALADQTTSTFLRAEITRDGDHPSLSEWERMDEANNFGGTLWDAPIKALRERSE